MELCKYNLKKDISKIFVRKTPSFNVIDDNKLDKLNNELVKVNTKIEFLSSSNTQTTRKLMSLQMLQTPDSTYRVLRQLLALIESKQQSLSEAYATLKTNYAKALQYKERAETATKETDKMFYEGMFEKKHIGIQNSISYIENAIKEVGSLIDAYNQILKNKNIPEDWDERDLEQEEIKAHIRSAFRNAIRDFLVHNAIGMGTCEYLEQFGISPVEAIYHVKNYLAKCNQQMQQGELPDYDNFHDFLNEMAEQYNDAYKKAMKRLGIDELLTKEYLQTMRNHDE